MKLKRAFWPVLVLLVLAILGCVSHSTSVSVEQGPKAPEFIGTAGDWLNSPPLKMKDLRGKVVLVDFWEYTCINCVRTYPYLNEWWNRYKDKGLVIVGIDSPEFKFGGSKKNIEESAKKYGLNYPLLVDNQYANWNAWHNDSWPAKYLVGGNGAVVAMHEGEGGYGEFEQKIQDELRKINPSVQLPPIFAPVRPADVPGALQNPLTDEIYAGERGLESGAFGYTNRPIGTPTDYQVPDHIQEGVIYLKGKWTPDDEYLEAPSGGGLTMAYMAKEVDMVLKPNQPPTLVEVQQDGAPVKQQDAGEDIFYRDGKSYMNVVSGRMYVVTNNKVWGHHRLDFTVLGPGLQVYSFAFASSVAG